MSNRKKYQEDAEARKFLEKFPEFQNQFIEAEETYTPQGIKKGSYSLYDNVEEGEKERVALLEKAVHAYPDSYLKEVMTRYFAGSSITELQKFMKVKKRKSVFEFISRAKRKLNKWYKSYRTRRVNLNKSIVIAEKRLVYNGTSKVVELRYDEYVDDYVWTFKNGWVLPEEVQRVLDEDEQFATWDDVLIDLGEEDSST
jgi:hypothetical protein